MLTGITTVLGTLTLILEQNVLLNGTTIFAPGAVLVNHNASLTVTVSGTITVGQITSVSEQPTYVELINSAGGVIDAGVLVTSEQPCVTVTAHQASGTSFGALVSTTPDCGSHRGRSEEEIWYWIVAGVGGAALLLVIVAIIVGLIVVTLGRHRWHRFFRATLNTDMARTL